MIRSNGFVLPAFLAGIAVTVTGMQKYARDGDSDLYYLGGGYWRAYVQKTNDPHADEWESEIEEPRDHDLSPKQARLLARELVAGAAAAEAYVKAMPRRRRSKVTARPAVTTAAVERFARSSE